MKVYVTRYDGGPAPRVVRLEEALARRLALAAGCRLVHNDLDLWRARPDRSIAKYRYQASAAAIWKVVFPLADRILAEMPGWAASPLERHVLRNEITVQLFRLGYDQEVVRVLSTELSAAEPWLPPTRRLPARAAALATLAFYRTRLRARRPAPVPVLPERQGPRTWLIFSGHAPSRVVANFANELDPAGLVALVNPPSMPADVLERLKAAAIPTLPIAPPVPRSWAEVRRLLDLLLAAAGRVAPELPPADLGSLLARTAVLWCAYAPVPERSGLAARRGDLVITGNDRTLNLATFVVEGARQGARTVTLQDGVFDGTLHVATFPSDRIGLFGEHFQRLYVAAGADPERLVVVGQRAFEAYRPGAAVTAAERAEVFGTGSRVVLFCTQYFPVSDLEMRDAIELALTAVARVPGWELVVKPHPGYAIDHVLAHLSRPVRKVKGPIARFLAAADAVLAISSTVLIEATLTGRPAAAVNASGRTGVCIVADGVAVRELTSAEAIARFLEAPPPVDVDRYRASNAPPFDPGKVRVLCCEAAD